MKKFTAEQEEYLRKLELSGRFDKYQMREISDGFLHNLSMAQVAVYADPQFNWEQMIEISLGFEEDLSMEQVKLYAKPEFNAMQM